MKLRSYINTYYLGSQANFARSVGVERQQITQWINKDFIVVDHVMYSPRRDLPMKARKSPKKEINL